jgi:hypothetical protein
MVAAWCIALLYWLNKDGFLLCIGNILREMEEHPVVEMNGKMHSNKKVAKIS